MNPLINTSKYKKGYVLGYIFTIGLSAFHIGFITSLRGDKWINIIAAAALVGTLIAGVLLTKVGRRILLVSAGTTQVLVTAILLFDDKLSYLYIPLEGIAIGVEVIISLLYLKEISPREIMGKAIIIGYQLEVNLGSFLAVFLKWVLEGDEHPKKIIAPYVALISVVQITLFTLFYQYDSPKFLYYISDTELSLQALNKLYTNEVEAFEEYSIIGESTEFKSTFLPFSKICLPQFRKMVIFGIFLMLFQQMTGVNVILQNLHNFIQGNSFFPHALGFANMAGCLVAIILVDQYGRLILLKVGSFLLSLCLFFASFLFLTQHYTSTAVFNTSLFITFALYMFSFGISFGPVLILYLVEIVPSIGIIFPMALHWALFLGLPFAFPSLEKNNPLPGYFCLVCAIFTLAAFEVVYRCGHETKMMKPKEILISFVGQETSEGKEKNASQLGGINSSFEIR